MRNVPYERTAPQGRVPARRLDFEDFRSELGELPPDEVGGEVRADLQDAHAFERKKHQRTSSRKARIAARSWNGAALPYPSSARSARASLSTCE